MALSQGRDSEGKVAMAKGRSRLFGVLAIDLVLSLGSMTAEAHQSVSHHKQVASRTAPLWNNIGAHSRLIEEQNEGFGAIGWRNGVLELWGGRQVNVVHQQPSLLGFKHGKWMRLVTSSALTWPVGKATITTYTFPYLNPEGDPTLGVSITTVNGKTEAGQWTFNGKHWAFHPLSLPFAVTPSSHVILAISSHGTMYVANASSSSIWKKSGHGWERISGPAIPNPLAGDSLAGSVRPIQLSYMAISATGDITAEYSVAGTQKPIRIWQFDGTWPPLKAVNSVLNNAEHGSPVLGMVYAPDGTLTMMLSDTQSQLQLFNWLSSVWLLLRNTCSGSVDVERVFGGVANDVHSIESDCGCSRGA